MAPVTINGNKIDPSTAGYFPEDASETDWIILQCNRDLVLADLDALKSRHVRIERMVGVHSFLCRYEPADLNALKTLSFVEDAHIYHPNFVIHQTLKNLVAAESLGNVDVHHLVRAKDSEAGPLCAVTIVLHNGTPQTGDSVLAAIHRICPEAEANGSSEHLLDVWMPAKFLPQVAALDHVRSIEPTKEVHPSTVPACRILEATQPPGAGPPGIYANQIAALAAPALADGEVVAVMDTGFDNGANTGSDLHVAFLSPNPRNPGNPKSRILVLSDLAGRGIAWDSDGHGTHVAGCVAGNWTATKAANRAAYPDSHQVRGAAPDARLHILRVRLGQTNGTSPAVLEASLSLKYSPRLAPARIRNHSFGRQIKDGNSPLLYLDQDAGVFDKAVFDTPELMLIFAATNAGEREAHAPGTGAVIQGHQVDNLAKNALMVGATWNNRFMNDDTNCAEGEPLPLPGPPAPLPGPGPAPPAPVPVPVPGPGPPAPVPGPPAPVPGPGPPAPVPGPGPGPPAPAPGPPAPVPGPPAPVPGPPAPVPGPPAPVPGPPAPVPGPPAPVPGPPAPVPGPPAPVPGPGPGPPAPVPGPGPGPPAPVLPNPYAGTKEPLKSVAAFSSKGPTGANSAGMEFLKPDIVAPGVGILSSRSRKPQPTQPTDPNYTPIRTLEFMSGTSQAAPMVTGCAAVLRQEYRTRNGGREPHGMLLRAMLINGAVSCSGAHYWVRDTTTDGRDVAGNVIMTTDGDVAFPGRTQRILGNPPDPIQGYGQVSLKRSMRHFDQATPAAPPAPAVPAQGGYQSPLTFNLGQSWPDVADATQVRLAAIPCVASQNVSVTLCWNDTPGELLQHRLTLVVRLPNVAGRARTAGSFMDPDPVINPWLGGGAIDSGTVKKVIWNNVPGALEVSVTYATGVKARLRFCVCWIID